MPKGKGQGLFATRIRNTLLRKGIERDGLARRFFGAWIGSYWRISFKPYRALLWQWLDRLLDLESASGGRCGWIGITAIVLDSAAIESEYTLRKSLTFGIVSRNATSQLEIIARWDTERDPIDWSLELDFACGLRLDTAPLKLTYERSLLNTEGSSGERICLQC